jgi:hypothetical protein
MLELIQGLRRRGRIQPAAPKEAGRAASAENTVQWISNADRRFPTCRIGSDRDRLSADNT